MVNHIKCCKDCEERKIECHAHCARYIAEKEKHEKNKETEKEWKGLDSYFHSGKNPKRKH